MRSIRTWIFNLIILLTLFSCTRKETETDTEISYYLQSPMDGDAIVEARILELERFGETIISGYMWTTSDEFTDVREGYQPGYCVVQLENIIWTNDTLFFELSPDTNRVRFFSRPVDVDIHPSEGSLKSGYTRWILDGNPGLRLSTAKYKCVLKDNQIRILSISQEAPYNTNPFEERTYREIKQLCRKIPVREEKRNRLGVSLDSLMNANGFDYSHP